jgi:glycosyltransferase involved in cell wall biosynthesis
VRLDVDLGFDAVPGRAAQVGEAQALDLHTIAAALRSPRKLRALLRARRFEEVLVAEGELPLSALQAVALLSLGVARTRLWVLDGRRMGRWAFCARALAEVSVAVPSELARSAALAWRVRRAARREYALKRGAEAAGSALYLRLDPSLKWHGAQVGGAATHTSGVINGLLDNGVAVEMLAPERPLGTDRARFREVPVRRILHVARGLSYSDYSEALLAATHGLRADFVYQRHQMGSYAGLELARRLGVPLVLEFNGSEIWVERNWRSGRLLLGGELERLELRNLRDASLVVVVSAPLRDFVVDQGVAAERVLVNPNGVDVDALAPYREQSPARWRARLGLPEAPTVGFIGTFGLWHGVKLLPALIEAVGEAQWVLIGGGDLLEEVRAEIEARGLSRRVRLTGVLERERALQMLACSDVCVSPHVPNPDGTPFFGSPTKLFEYMGLQRAIVASDLDQIGEVIEHERSGLLCPPGDVPPAADAVRRLLADEPLRERLALEALRRATSEHSWSAHARRILDALSHPCGPAPAAPLVALPHEYACNRHGRQAGGCASVDG